LSNLPEFDILNNFRNVRSDGQNIEGGKLRILERPECIYQR